MGHVNFEEHPLYPAPSAALIQEKAELWGVPAAAAAEKLAELRKMMIDTERKDPFNYPYVPRIWTVVWSLLDWPYWPGGMIKAVEDRFGCDLWTFMRMMRESLGFKHPVSRLWVSGANGASKSELVAFMVNAQAAAKQEQLIYVMSTTAGGSVEAGLHSKLHKYIPKPWLNVGKTAVGYVSYKEQTGFPDGTYTLPNKSKVGMKFYSQDASTEGEGFDADAIFPDESIPADWFERLPARVGRKNGFILHTNTPQLGYTEVVHEFMEGLQVTRWCCGYLLPKDGLDVVPEKALGLSSDEYQELLDAHASRPVRASRVPECKSEDCWGWLEEPSDAAGDWHTLVRPIRDAPAVQDGTRLFEAVPRVGRCADEDKAVVWFHSSDNPFGYPRNLISMMAGKDLERIRCRLYGVVTPSQNSIFAGFRREVHMINPELVPTDGTRYMIQDPAPGRNAFILWGVCVGDSLYIYREFPGNYSLPGQGYPGRWAKTSGRKKGVNDGDRAEATKSFGWGTAKYKAVVAWLERWKDFMSWAESNGSAGGSWPKYSNGDPIWPQNEEVKQWRDSPFSGDSEEPIRRRFMDPRGGGAPQVGTEGTSTLIGDYIDMGMRFDPAFSGTVMSGIDKIITALDYDLSAGIQPKLFISRNCVNLIYAMEVWKDEDGEASATKDPLDCLRYFFSSGCVDCGTVRHTAGESAWIRNAKRETGADSAGDNVMPKHPTPQSVEAPRRRRTQVRVC